MHRHPIDEQNKWRQIWCMCASSLLPENQSTERTKVRKKSNAKDTGTRRRLDDERLMLNRLRNGRLPPLLNVPFFEFRVDEEYLILLSFVSSIGHIAYLTLVRLPHFRPIFCHFSCALLLLNRPLSSSRWEKICECAQHIHWQTEKKNSRDKGIKWSRFHHQDICQRWKNSRVSIAIVLCDELFRLLLRLLLASEFYGLISCHLSCFVRVNFDVCISQ